MKRATTVPLERDTRRRQWPLHGCCVERPHGEAGGLSVCFVQDPNARIAVMTASSAHLDSWSLAEVLLKADNEPGIKARVDGCVQAKHSGERTMVENGGSQAVAPVHDGAAENAERRIESLTGTCVSVLQKNRFGNKVNSEVVVAMKLVQTRAASGFSRTHQARRRSPALVPGLCSTWIVSTVLFLLWPLLLRPSSTQDFKVLPRAKFEAGASTWAAFNFLCVCVVCCARVMLCCRREQLGWVEGELSFRRSECVHRLSSVGPGHPRKKGEVERSEGWEQTKGGGITNFALFSLIHPPFSLFSLSGGLLVSSFRNSLRGLLVEF